MKKKYSQEVKLKTYFTEHMKRWQKGHKLKKYSVASHVTGGYQTMVWFITRNTLLNLFFFLELWSYCAIVWTAHSQLRLSNWACPHIRGMLCQWLFSCCSVATKETFWLILFHKTHRSRTEHTMNGKNKDGKATQQHFYIFHRLLLFYTVCLFLTTVCYLLNITLL